MRAITPGYIKALKHSREVVSISRKRTYDSMYPHGELVWHVNKTRYVVTQLFDKDWNRVYDINQAYNCKCGKRAMGCVWDREKHLVCKNFSDLFLTKEDAQKECARRNELERKEKVRKILARDD